MIEIIHTPHRKGTTIEVPEAITTIIATPTAAAVTVVDFRLVHSVAPEIVVHIVLHLHRRHNLRERILLSVIRAVVVRVTDAHHHREATMERHERVVLVRRQYRPNQAATVVAKSILTIKSVTPVYSLSWSKISTSETKFCKS